MNIIEERINHLIEYSNFRKVLRIFNEYFGEDLVDCKEIIDTDNKSRLISYDTVDKFIKNTCRVGISGEDNNQYKIRFGDCIKHINISDYNEVKDKDINHIPEILVPLIDEIWNNLNRFTNYIIVRFPKVTVTNEQGKHVDIQELYARISVLTDGVIARKFELIRSYYPLDQWYSDYCHSHISHISTDWLEPCTGTGPINYTINSLESNFNEDRWGLFCYELDKFVRVESLAGIPYRRLESIGVLNEYPVGRTFRRNELTSFGYFDENLMKDFIKEVINAGVLKTAFISNKFTIGDTFESFWIKVSKVFAKWYNHKYKEGEVTLRLKNLLERHIVERYIIKSNKVYKTRDRLNNLISEEGTLLFYFKGNPVNLKVNRSKSNASELNATYLLNLGFVESLLYKILIILNFNYGRKEEANTDETQPKRRTIYI